MKKLILFPVIAILLIIPDAKVSVLDITLHRYYDVDNETDPLDTGKIMKVRYLEIVTPDVDGTIAIFVDLNGAKFSNPIADLGNSRVAEMPSGGQIGVRAPMHAAEEVVTRTYFSTDDIEAVTERAVAAGAELAVPVMDVPGQGKFSIVFQGGNQFGYWQD